MISRQVVLKATQIKGAVIYCSCTCHFATKFIMQEKVIIGSHANSTFIMKMDTWNWIHWIGAHKQRHASIVFILADFYQVLDAVVIISQVMYQINIVKSYSSTEGANIMICFIKATVSQIYLLCFSQTIAGAEEWKIDITMLNINQKKDSFYSSITLKK